MIRAFVTLVFTLFVTIPAAIAQTNTDDVAWVQMEAQPSLTIAQQRAEVYSRDLQDVNGFALGNGWYAVALGPYSRADAETVLRVYRSEGLIPRDAYIAQSAAFRGQFYPDGVNVLNLTANVQTQLDIAQGNIPPAEVIAPPQPADETPREARTSEAALTKAERKELQSWLKWAGFYSAAIDGSFGRGTRGSMAAWQGANAYEETGVMTTMQRAALRNQFYAVLKGMDLERVTNFDAGIEMMIPRGVVAQGKTEFPFVHYDAKGNLAAKVLLISQEGDQGTLFGLYDIMQTLEIVPLTGERERKKNSFVLIGENGRFVSYTQATLKGGQIKGFTLVWPAGDEERRTRILGEMKASFTRVDGVLDPAAGSNASQNIDLLAGLDIRKPKLSRSGFFVDTKGTVVTTSAVIASCTKITLENTYDAELIAVNDALGVAVLRPTNGLAPMDVATMRNGDARLQSDVAVSGYSYEGVLGAPTMTFGLLADVVGLNGETDMKRLALTTLPGDAGGPVLDSQGAVMGMLLPKTTSGPQLPKDVSFAAGSDAIRAVLDQAGVRSDAAAPTETMAPEDITRLASGMTVLVSCWE